MHKVQLSTLLLAGTLALGGCDSSTLTNPAAETDPAAEASPLPAAFSAAEAPHLEDTFFHPEFWAKNFGWNAFLGAPGSATGEVVTHTIYFIASVDEPDENTPRHPGVGPHNHVVPLQASRGASFTAVANEAAVVPGEKAVLFGPNTNVAWRCVDTPAVASVPFCGDVTGRLPHLYGADIDGDGCIEPLTSAERIEAAVAQELATGMPLPVPPFHFALEPATERGTGVIRPPECVSSA